MGSEGRGGFSLGVEGDEGEEGFHLKNTNKPERGSEKQLCFCVRGFMRSRCTRLPPAAETAVLGWDRERGCGWGPQMNKHSSYSQAAHIRP